MGPSVMCELSAGCGILLLSGLWTPVVGTLVALIEVWRILTFPEDRWFALLVGSIGAALAMLGPGSWSADAHFFGWKRIESHPVKSFSKSR
jgi:putative oxidoreductase